ncbi:alpha/beta fold hydrolase [Candidatus Chloroploca asiatica]|nr:alpha/beta fold hydrolase [Candidatus Chloroploca asiatica]
MVAMQVETSARHEERRYSVTEHYLDGPLGPTRYWASTPVQGLPVVFIHGYGALIDHWRKIVRSVAREHTFYALDLYGFGYSARPEGQPSKVRWAEQIAHFVQNVVGGPAVIVGHSMGGVAATEFTRRFPELTRALILVNSSGMQLYERPLTPTDQVLLSLIGAPVIGETVAGIFGNEWGVRQSLLASYHRKEAVTPELVETFSGPLRRFGANSYLAVTRSSVRFGIDMQPGEYNGPTLLIWGAEDRSIPPSDAEAIKQRILPQAEIAILPDTGHCPFDETPELFTDALLPWLAKLG